MGRDAGRDAQVPIPSATAVALHGGTMAKKADLSRTLIDAALDLAADVGWQGVTLHGVAARAGVGLGDLYRHFPCKTAILTGLMRQADAAVLGEDAETAAIADETPRDRLVDVMMRRFDALAPYRAGLKRVIADLRRDPATALALAPALDRSMGWMLEAADIPASGLRGALRIKGLEAIHLRVMRVWLDDDTADLARTMAALDSRLRRAERFSTTLRSGVRARRTKAPDQPAP